MCGCTSNYICQLCLTSDGINKSTNKRIVDVKPVKHIGIVEYGYIGLVCVCTSTDIDFDHPVNIVRWGRPYGIPYAVDDNGKEYHQSQLIVVR